MNNRMTELKDELFCFLFNINCLERQSGLSLKVFFSNCVRFFFLQLLLFPLQVLLFVFITTVLTGFLIISNHDLILYYGLDRTMPYRCGIFIVIASLLRILTSINALIYPLIYF